MNQTRYYQVKGHEGNPMAYLCTFKDCKLESKWICADCGVQQIHIHGQPNQNHLMKQQQFLDFIKKQSKLLLIQKQEDKRPIQICIKELQNLIKSTQILIQRLEEELDLIENNYNLDETEQIIKNNYFLLENQQIEKIININHYNENYQNNLSQDVLKQLIKIDEDLKKLLKNNIMKQNFQVQLDKQIIQPNAQLVYKGHIQYEEESEIYTSQISYDEKYLVIGGSDYKIQLYDILSRQLIKYIQIDNMVQVCRFTKDSKYLICGDFRGYLYCFDIENNFYQQYKNQIHYDWIRDVYLIDNDQIITCSSDKTIKITNIKQKAQQLLIKNAHNSSINTIDFDKQNDVIISGSSDASIKFFNKTTGVMQLQKQYTHDSSVLQIQLIPDQNNNLLSSDLTNLILWQIDYCNKQLHKIKVLDQNHFNFTSVANNNRIILVCKKKVQILGQNLSFVQSIDHNLKISNYFNTRQTNSMNYIIVLSFSAFQVLKRV